jgi:hypothetical protein
VVLPTVIGGFLLLTAVAFLFGNEFVRPIVSGGALGKPLAALEPAAVALAAIAIGLLIDRGRFPATVAAGALLGLGAITVASALGAAGSHVGHPSGEPTRAPVDITSAGLVSVSVLAALGVLPSAALLGVGVVTVGSLGATGWFGEYGPVRPHAGPSALFVGGLLVLISGLAARGAFRRPTRRGRIALRVGCAGVLVATAGVLVPVHVQWVALLLLIVGVLLAGLATAIALGGRVDVPTHPLSPLALGGAALILVALAGSHAFFNTADVQHTSWTALELATSAAVGLAAAVLARWEAERVFAATMLLAAGTQASLFLLPYILARGGGGASIALLGALALAREGWRMLQSSDARATVPALHS